MKEFLSNQNKVESVVSLENRVILAIDGMNRLTDKISQEIGKQWEEDRFGKYKADHMIKMAEKSDKIIDKYQLDKNKEIEKYLPLFKFICRSHDVGRHFHNDKRYVDENGNFLDHGEISFRFMKDNNIMNYFSDDEQKIIEYTVKNHSLKEVVEPIDDVEKKTQVFCLVFRDMDKLEILNNRDFLKATEIYRLLGLHFNLDEYKKEWKDGNNKLDHVQLIQHLLNGEDPDIQAGLGSKIKKIINGPLQENIGNINIIKDFVEGKSLALDTYKKTKSYANYILYLLSLLNGITYSCSFLEIDEQIINEKLNFLKSRSSEFQYNKIKFVLRNKYNFKVD